MRERLVPCAIAAIVPIEHGQTTIPSVCTDPDAGWAPRSESLKARTDPQSPPVAFVNAASSLMPHSSVNKRQPCAEMSSHVVTRLVARTSSRRTAYGAPEAPVMARTSGGEEVVTAQTYPLARAVARALIRLSLLLGGRRDTNKKTTESRRRCFRL